MSNKTTLQTNNTIISNNNLTIDDILNTINNLPEAGSEPVLQSKTVSPSTASQTVKPDSGYDGLSQVTVNAMTTATQATPSITVSSSGLITASATQTAGYVSAGTKSATKQLTTKAATTYTPTTSDQTIASGTYLTGTQTIKGDSNLVASNIKNGISIFGVTGTLEAGGGGTSQAGIIFEEFDSDGYPTVASIGGFTSMPSKCFQDIFVEETDFYATCLTKSLTSIKLQKGLTLIGTYAFRDCNKLQSIEIPDGVTTINSNAFENCENLELTEIPDSVTSIGTGAFKNCNKITNLIVSSGLTNLSTQCFQYVNNLKEITFKGEVTNCGDYICGENTYLESIYLPNITSVPTITSATFSSINETFNIYVPYNLLTNIKTANNWKNYAERIGTFDIHSINIKQNSINTYKTNSIELTVEYNDGSLVVPSKRGYTIELVSGNATLNGNIITLNDNAQVGDKIVVTVTSTYDTSISSTKELEVINQEPTVSVNLNDGQWEDSGTTVDNNVVYKSAAGSYNTNSGKSIATINIVGCTVVKLYIRSYAENNYDYTEAFAIDTVASRGAGLHSTKGKSSSSDYVECVYNLDGNNHYIQIMYSKDSSGNSNDDRGYFYIGYFE